MNQLTPKNNNQMMSSREIAELTGKQHKNVIRDIKKIVDDLIKDGSELSHQAVTEIKDKRGYTSEFFLDEDMTSTLMMGYSTTARYKVAKRWRELETGVAKPIHQTQNYSLADSTQAASILCDSLRLSNSGRITAMRAFCNDNAPHLLSMLPEYAVDAPTGSESVSSEVSHSATHLLKERSIGVSAVAFNTMCKNAGLLEQLIRKNSKNEDVKFWSVTDKALEYAKNITSPQNPRQTSVHWYDSKFDEVLKLLKLSS